MENRDANLTSCIRYNYHCEINTILTDNKYTACNAQSPRKLCKQKMDIVLKILEERCGDSQESILNSFVDLLIEQEMDTGNEAFPFPIPSFYNISRKNKLFSGREDILNNVFLQLAENNLVFLTGPGGIGKSQIARETVFQAKSKYELILWFSVNSEYDLVEEFNNAALYYKLIPEKSTDFDSIFSILSAFINRYDSSLIIYDGADDIPIDFLTTNCFFTNSDIIVFRSKTILAIIIRKEY